MTGAVSLPVPLSSISHHPFLAVPLAMPVPAYVVSHDRLLACRPGAPRHR
jgi:hypothetical protein